MKVNKIFLGIFILWQTVSMSAQAQLTFNVYSENHHTISSYDGLTSSPMSYTFHLMLGSQDLFYEKWSLSMQVIGPMTPMQGTNIAGSSFPVEKIQVRLTSDDGNQPTLAAAGAQLNFLTLQNSELYFIRNAKSPLRARSGFYSEVKYYFQFKILGGAYLEKMRSSVRWGTMQYRLPVRYTLSSEKGEVLGRVEATYIIQVNYDLTGNPGSDAEPDFSISILNEARDGRLEFKDINAYQNGVNKSYLKGLKINSSTAYEVKVKAVNSAFMSDFGDMMDLNMVKLKLVPELNSSRISSFELPLSNSLQTYISSSEATNQAQFFHMNYSMDVQDKRILKLKPGSYATPVLFQLLPR